jgi:hypothetical protein
MIWVPIASSASSYCVTTNDFYDVSSGGITTKETSKKGNVQDATGRTGGKQQFIYGGVLVLVSRASRVQLGKMKQYLGGGANMQHPQNMTIYKVAPSAIFNRHTHSIHSILKPAGDVSQ